MNFYSLIILAVLVEALYSNLRMIWDKNKFNLNNLGVLVLAIIVTVLTNVDIFPIVELPMSVHFVGSILTGVLVSRGANVVFDLIDKLNTSKTKKEKV